ncbi:hypothetical protein QQG55_40855 [Brugia pahangi]
MTWTWRMNKIKEGEAEVHASNACVFSIRRAACYRSYRKDPVFSIYWKQFKDRKQKLRNCLWILLSYRI